MSDNNSLTNSSSDKAGADTAAPVAPPWERELLEKTVLAAVREQRAARRWKIFFRLAFLIIFVVMSWHTVSVSSGKAGGTGGKHTALVTLEGEIAADKQSNAANLNAALERAFSAEQAAGVVLQMNSPGGSPVQAGMVNDEIRRLRARYPHKPLYVVVDDICASGAYYIAVAADKIFVDKASIVGSIGVRMDSFGFTDLMSKLGVERRLLTAGRNKALNDPFLPEDSTQKKYMQSLLNEVHQQFIEVVRQGRGKRLKEMPEIFSGLVWTGQRSIELGLVDGLGDMRSVARDVLKAEKLVDYTVKEGVFDRFARKFGLSAGASAVRALTMQEQVSLH
ncbi:hypothetical protein BGZ97_006773 [Linnemannia gamsii]|uniref:Peptidase S49 domain-containing protein n=1 Tax=Linnemannia gamsii TaxID=64522 RepID=A0A9P6UX26_9FUNG|nr:hypothetical protein BGZ97_006773 [Linnemannia gamsii]